MVSVRHWTASVKTILSGWRAISIRQRERIIIMDANLVRGSTFPMWRIHTDWWVEDGEIWRNYYQVTTDTKMLVEFFWHRIKKSGGWRGCMNEGSARAHGVGLVGELRPECTSGISAAMHVGETLMLLGYESGFAITATVCP